MAQTDQNKTPQSEPGDDDQVLRKRLLKRVAIAAAIVLVLLGALMLFETGVTRDESQPQEVARIAAPPKVIEKPVEKPAEEPAAVSDEQKPAESAGEKTDAATEAAKEPEAEPELTEAPTQMARRERPLTVPARAHQAMVRPAEPALPAKKPAPTADIAHAAAKPSPASRPIASAVEAVRHFLVQVGVFNNVANAEELRDKIEAAGVPARVEARVQVGPFASRQEAEQAREKLKSIGIETGLIVATRK